MTINDKGIIYQGKVNEVLASIESLEELNLDMTSAREELARIQSTVETGVAENYSSYGDGKAQSFLHSSLQTGYTTATKSLDSLNERLKAEWNEYYKIDKECNEITSRLKDANEGNFPAIVVSTLHLLNLMRNSSTIDYKVEKAMVERVYGIIYQVIKLELLYYPNNCRVFKAVKEDETDTSYVAGIVNKELKEVDSEEIKRLVATLQKNGMDSSNLLDKRLISLLTIINKPELVSEKVEKFISDTEDYLRKRASVNDLNDRIDSKNRSIDELTKERRTLGRKITTKRLIALLNAIIVSLGITAGVTFSKHVAKVNEYHTITTSYDSSTGELSSEESYERGKDGKLTITEYSPWNSPGVLRDDEFERKQYTYSIPSEDYELYPDVREYIDSKIQGRYSYSSTTEYSKEQPEDYGYGENKYVVVRTSKDTDKVIKTESPILFGLYSFLISAGLITADVLLFKRLSKEKLQLIKERRSRVKEDLEEEKKEKTALETRITPLEKDARVARDIALEDYSLLPFAVRSYDEVAKQYKKI